MNIHFWMGVVAGCCGVSLFPIYAVLRSAGREGKEELRKGTQLMLVVFVILLIAAVTITSCTSTC